MTIESQKDNVIWAFGTDCKIGIQLDKLYTNIAQATIAIQQNNSQNTYAEITCIDDMNQTHILPS